MSKPNLGLCGGLRQVPIKKFGIRATLLFIGLQTLGACSVSLFGKGQPDSTVFNTPAYRKVNTECSQLGLSKDRLDVQSVRQLVQCFNSQGALPVLAKWVKEVPDPLLDYWVSVLNAALLDRPKVLYQIDQTIQAGDQKKLWEPLLDSFSRATSNAEFISVGIETFEIAFRETDSQGQPRWDPEFLTQLREIAELLAELSPNQWKHDTQSALDWYQVVYQHPDYKGWSSQLFESRLGTDGALWESLAQAWGAEAFNKRLLELIDLYEAGHTTSFLESWLPNYKEPVASAFWSRWLGSHSAIIHKLVESAGARKVLALFSALRSPIPCLDGKQSIQQASVHMLEQLANEPDANRFSQKLVQEQMLNLFLTKPLCDYPKEVIENYSVVTGLDQTAAHEALYLSVQSLTQSPELTEWFVNAAPDLANPLLDWVESPSLNRSGSSVLDGFLLFGSLPTAVKSNSPGGESAANATRQRKAFANQLRHLLPVLQKGFKKVPATQWVKLANAFHQFHQAGATDSEWWLGSTTQNLSAWIQLNQSTPVFDLLNRALLAVAEDPKVLDQMFALVHTPYFESAIAEVSQMAGSKDGRLKEILSSTLALFRTYSEKGKVEIIAGAPEPAVWKARHSFGLKDLQASQAMLLRERQDLSLSPIGVTLDACQSLSLKSDWTAPLPDQQFEAWLLCVGRSSSVAEFMTHFNQAGLFGWIADQSKLLWHALELNAAEVQALTARLFKAELNGDLDWLWSGLPLWSEMPALPNLFSFLSQDHHGKGYRKAVRQWSLEVADGLQSAEFAGATEFLEALIDQKQWTPTVSKKSDYDLNRMIRWVRNKECSLYDRVKQPEYESMRAAALLQEFNEAVANQSSTAHQAFPLPEQWSWQDLESLLNPLLEKLSEPTVYGDLVAATQRLLARYADTSVYPQGTLYEWFQKRAEQKRLISYFFPDETKPRVRLVSVLDELELLLINSDISAPPPLDMNIGLFFLANLAEAWGDEPFEKWPEPIQKKFPKNGGQKPQTLRQATQDMQDALSGPDGFAELAGYPVLAPCHQVADPSDPADEQRREITDPTTTYPVDPFEPGTDGYRLQAKMFNMVQLIDQLVKDPLAMRPVRDLLYEFYYSTPEAYRNPESLGRNNLSTLIQGVKLGVLRQVGRLIRSTSAETGAPVQAQKQWLSSFLSLSQNEGLINIVRVFTQTQQGQRALKLFAQTWVEGISTHHWVEHARAILFYGAPFLENWDNYLKARNRVNGVGALADFLKPSAVVLSNAASQDYLGPLENAVGLSWATDLFEILLSERMRAIAEALEQSHAHSKRAEFSVWLEKMLLNKDLPLATATLFEGLVSPNEGYLIFYRLREQWSAIAAKPEWQAELWENQFKLLLHRLQGRDPSLSLDEALAMRKFPQAMGKSIQFDQAQGVLELWDWFGKDPKGAELLLESVAEMAREKSFQRFLITLQKNLDPIKKSR